MTLPGIIMKKLLFSLVVLIFFIAFVIQIKAFDLLWEFQVGMHPLSENELLILFYGSTLIVIGILTWAKEIWDLKS